MGKPKKGQSVQPKQPPQETEPAVTLAIKISRSDRDRVQAAAGWGGMRKFIHAAVIEAVRKIEAQK